MPIILLIRHGENEYTKTGRLAGRLPDVHLNERGRAQAQALAEKLTGAPVKALYSSPMERTLETAGPIAQALGLEVISRPGLMEVDIGEWHDQKIKGLSRQKVWRKVQTFPSLMRFPGGESFAEAQARICQELMALVNLHEPKDLIACVTHADPIKLAISYFIGQPLDMFQRLHVSTASVSGLAIGEGGVQLLMLNYDLSLTFPRG